MTQINYPFRGSYPITQVFGENPGDYKKFNLVGHNGIDFGLPLKTPVLAACDGVVKTSKYDSGWGEYVEIYHPDQKFRDIYAHLTVRQVTVGEQVKAGQVIGLSGSTGNSTGPHLHYGIYPDDVSKNNGYNGATDPLPWLSATPVSSPPAPLGDRVTVVTDILNIRTAPGISSPDIGDLLRGNVLQRAGIPLAQKDGITWVPLIVWAAREYDDKTYLE